MAKIASGGRIVKVAELCRPFKTLNFLKECKSWDPTITEPQGRTQRDLKHPDWPVKGGTL